MILIRLDRVMVEKRMSLRRLSQKVGISEVNLSRIKNNKVKSVRLETLNELCKALDCHPKDLLEFRWDLDDWEEEKLI